MAYLPTGDHPERRNDMHDLYDHSRSEVLRVFLYIDGDNPESDYLRQEHEPITNPGAGPGLDAILRLRLLHGSGRHPNTHRTGTAAFDGFAWLRPSVVWGCCYCNGRDWPCNAAPWSECFRSRKIYGTLAF